MEKVEGAERAVEGPADGEAVAPVEVAEGEAAAASPHAASDESADEVRADRRALVLHFLFGALVIGAVFWWLQFSTGAICCGDYDAYYHFRWSRMLWEGMLSGNFPPAFDALPLTTLNPRDYVDHHFLFHVFQIPFTWFGDGAFAPKVGTWLFATLAVLSLYWLILRQRIRYPVVWLTALLGCSAPFLYRMHMGKAMSVSIVMLVAGIHLLFRRKYVWLLPLAFVFTLTYDMFALLIAAALIWSAVVWWCEGRLEWRPLAWVGLGCALGFVVNPYFPHNLQLFYEHLVIKVTPKDFTTRVGNEWYPYESWDFLGNCMLAFVATVAGYVAFNPWERRGNERRLFFLVFSTLLLIANARWRRFAEYWPPFAVLFAAFTLDPLLAGARAAWGRLPEGLMRELRPLLDREARPETVRRERGDRLREFAVAGFVLAVIAAPMTKHLLVTSKDIADSHPHERYRGGMEWVSKNVPAGEPVYNLDWDDFPKLFWYDPQRSFISGLDPTYLLDRNPELQKLYESIGTNKEENPGPLIRERFCVGEGDARRCPRYVFSDHDHEDFNSSALDSGWFDEVYADDDSVILRIRDQRGEPPPDEAEAEDKTAGEDEGEGAQDGEGGDDVPDAEGEEANAPTP